MNEKLEGNFTTFKNEKYKKLNIEEPNSIFITFKFTLPFRIPVEQDSLISFDKDGVLINFLHKTTKLSDDVHLNEGRYTVVECTSVLKGKKAKKIISNNREGKIKKQFSEIFDEQLEILNNVIKIISLKFHYHNIYKLALGHILSIPLYIIYNTERKIVNSGIFLLEMPNKIYSDQQSTLSNEQMKELTESYYLQLNNPVEEVASNMRKSERSNYLGDYNSSIVNAQTALEVFVTQIVENYYRLKIQKSEEKIKNILACGYSNLIKDHLIPLLEKLDIQSSEGIKNAINLYLEKFYNMRNSIVHRGKEYKREHAENFRLIVTDLINMIVFTISNQSNDNFVGYIKTYFKLNEEFNIDEVANKYR